MTTETPPSSPLPDECQIYVPQPTCDPTATECTTQVYPPGPPCPPETTLPPVTTTVITVPPDTDLPRTGDDLIGVRVGAATLILGMLLAVAARRRKDRHAS